MRENYTLPRLYLDNSLGEGGMIALGKAQSHYLGTVLRKSIGDSVRVFNGRDGEWRAEKKAQSLASPVFSLSSQRGHNFRK